MKKLIRRITKDSYFLKGVIGVSLCLFSIFGALDNGIISEFITWVLAFLFGWFLYAFYLIIFLIGLRLIFAKKEVNLRFSITIFGVILICLGILVLATNSKTTNGDNYLVFNNFYSELIKVANPPELEFPKLNYQGMSGGFIGYLLVSVLNSGVSPVGTIVVGSLFLCLGIVLALSKIIIKLFKNLNDYRNKTLIKNNLDQKQYSKAHDVKAFDTDSIMKDTKLTTVVTQDFNIPREHTQTIAIQNPNGGVGVGVTSVNNADSNIHIATFEITDDMKTNDDFNNNESNVSNSNLEANQNKVEHNDENIAPKFEEKLNKVDSNSFFDNVVEDSNQSNQEEINNKQDEISLDTIKVAQTKFDSENFEKKINNESRIVNTNNNVKSDIEVSTMDLKEYIYPSIELLKDRQQGDSLKNLEVCSARMDVINQAFKDFKIGAQATSYTIGPSVTRFDIFVNADESAKTIEKYVDDIARRLKGQTCRFIQVVPDKDTSGLEIANVERTIVNFKDCVRYLNATRKKPTEICFGKDIAGQYITADLTEFPHLLVSGCTNSGKSIFIHSLIATLLMRCRFDELKIAIIDPKFVEFMKYKNNPFLLCPPVIESEEALLLLNEIKDLMNERYEVLAEAGVENIKQYNRILAEQGKPPMPRIVLIVDEYADLVEANKKVSEPIRVIAGKARAAGIHLILATQRPSVNVIDGVIKGNINTRVALLCSSAIDSQTILGFGGAEKLTGYGDMLLNSPLISREGAVRVQGSLLESDEIKKLNDSLVSKYGTHYVDRFCTLMQKQINMSEQKKTEDALSFTDKKNADYEELYEIAKKEIIEGSYEYCSISLLTRLYSIGYNKAGRIMRLLIQNGIVSATNSEGNKGNKILVKENTNTKEFNGSIEQSTFKKDTF